MVSKSKKKTKLFGIILVMILLVLLVIGILIFTGKLNFKTTEYTVSYEINGHGNPVETIKAESLPEELPTLTEEGWKFEGWYYDSACTKKAEAKDEIKENTKLYAKWTEDKKTPVEEKVVVTFDTQGGSTVNAVEVTKGGKVTKPATDPTKDDKVFAGWYKESACTTPWNFSTDVVNEDTTIYAKWEALGQTVIQDGEISIHFLELGNYYAGDSVYIKAGDIDILIDAGSRASSSTAIHNYIKDYCTDGKLEYVIATHAHQDHIAGFVGTKTNPGIFDLYECEVIIDYAFRKSTTSIASNYEAKRDAEVALGAKHYTAKDCIDGTNGASKTYQLTNQIQFEILDQKFYHEKASDENDHSVCLMLSYGDNHFLFTGDLEHDGEESLVERNELPHCKVFKGGHHGSKTSSNEILLSKITPEVVCVCCCAGSSEYTDNVDNMFPTQDFITRVAKYTERVYVTTLAKYTIAKNKEGQEYPKVNGFESMNGNIVVTLNSNAEVIVECSNNNTLLKDTAWFNSTLVLNGVERKMRIWP